MYSYLKKEQTTKLHSRDIDHPKCSKLNFPIKSFYSEVTKECTTFYRQGYCITVDPSTENMENRFEQITESDLGAMYLLFDEALVTRSSGNILFFKRDEENNGEWKQYF